MIMKVLFEADDATLKFDEHNSIFTFVWNGTISLNTLKSVVLETARHVDKMESASLFFDRRKLESYAPEAKSWIKNDFMKKDGKILIKKIDKIAAVNSKSTFAQLLSTLLVGVLRLYNRNIDYKVFDEPSPALDWLYAVKVS